jgi:DNA-binding transcriptional ArsR family regulator
VATPLVRCQVSHILDDIIDNVSEEAPALVPLFRSEQQMRLLGALFTPDAEPMSIGELAERAGVAQSTASREVARLLEHGIVVDRAVGRTRLVSANRSLPWAPDLQALLAKTIGVPSMLSSALGDVPGVDEAWVFGSWAARYEGHPGPPPADIDVLVVGTAPLRRLRSALRAVEANVGVEVNPVVLDRAQWDDLDDAFASTVREGPLVRVPLPAATR